MKVDERRRRLVDAAFEVIARDGVSGASTRAICAQADMPQSAFHYAFKSKRELLMELTKTVIEEQSVRVLDDDQSPATFEDSVCGALNQVMRVGMERADQQMVLHELMVLEFRDDSGDGLLNRWRYQHTTDVAKNVLDDLAQTYGMTWRVSVDSLARLLATSLTGTIIAWLGDRDDALAYAAIEALSGAVVALAEPVA